MHCEEAAPFTGPASESLYTGTGHMHSSDILQIPEAGHGIWLNAL